jgi:chromosome segregation ATPase
MVHKEITAQIHDMRAGQQKTKQRFDAQLQLAQNEIQKYRQQVVLREMAIIELKSRLDKKQATFEQLKAQQLAFASQAARAQAQVAQVEAIPREDSVVPGGNVDSMIQFLGQENRKLEAEVAQLRREMDEGRREMEKLRTERDMAHNLVYLRAAQAQSQDAESSSKAVGAADGDEATTGNGTGVAAGMDKDHPIMLSDVDEMDPISLDFNKHFKEMEAEIAEKVGIFLYHFYIILANSDISSSS